MIELHDKEWESSSAVEARDCSQGCKKLGLCRPVRGSSCEVARHSLRSRRKDIFGLDPVVCPNRVTIRAHDVALRDLGEENVPSLQQDFAGRERERLGLRIAVIEVHDPGRKTLATVGARSTSQVPEKLECRRLANSDPLDFF